MVVTLRLVHAETSRVGVGDSSSVSQIPLLSRDGDRIADCAQKHYASDWDTADQADLSFLSQLLDLLLSETVGIDTVSSKALP